MSEYKYMQEPSASDNLSEKIRDFLQDCTAEGWEIIAHQAGGDFVTFLAKRGANNPLL